MKTEDLDIVYKDEAVAEIAEIATLVNDRTENIGARRLHTVLTTLLEDILFDPISAGKKVSITGKKVSDKLSDIIDDEDLSRYIL